jgi:hypothetical protein
MEKKMMDSNPVRCQKCGKPIGYITILGKGLLGMQQQVHNYKIVGICMNCSQK